ncbi:MAG: aminotransferase class I/II-fold pyridoxal phosphate-dependent enzyme [Alphaproteobacteria bacterium]|nr:aminotransferase class I/II-fold pyridoxal phosphate-dependent enzyme [Alphaproteobacteria bacterium]
MNARAPKSRFTGNFTQQKPIPDAGIKAALAVMQSGRLHRYNVTKGELGETALLEREFASAMGAKYCLAVASGGAALSISLRAIGVKPGQTVLTNAFTLAPVPGAIANVGAVPAFVDVTDNLVIDLDHLDQMIAQTDARTLLLSHMRGHICQMERLMDLCNRAKIQVIEDCAHTMGARWNETLSGRFGQVGCYSTQTYKHMNSGEGGLIISDDATAMARATMLSGSYMLYERHGAGPEAASFKDICLETPNCSARMDNLRAALLRPQLTELAENCTAWTERYRVVEAGLSGTSGLKLIERPNAEAFVGSSIQFLLPEFSPTQITTLIDAVAARGVELKWFGAASPQGFTSRYSSWTYAPKQSLPQTDRVLDGLMDMRLPLTFSLADCALIAAIIRDEVQGVATI